MAAHALMESGALIGKVVLAVRGFKSAEGRLDLGLRGLVVDALIGFAIAAPVFWMFTQLLAINLPGLTATGWL